MKQLICTDVQRLAWNDEKVTFENEDVKVIIHIKNPELHGKVSKGVDAEEIFGSALPMDTAPTETPVKKAKPRSRRG